ncbi:protein SERAC1 [Marchantia polymorpha subsp. ruderalis]|uniref:Glycoside hydrolase family 19 catalytic domain-containing protein n=2 Tax=Marchantia polymorpha TaxID=3197 RepID=A0AAF6BD17_MARPO|nr:hypothetical protein MARPO_0020s0126 [Marchantia polymorpha]BBN09901.1 hypothetical protein Mp_4g23630 [Marchantia polymorpha subsp. ruderalis]|eukprot:PTQ44478.1 hypothetical protein MARPO_0020s0126 [Marchantia polymorpha]
MESKSWFVGPSGFRSRDERLKIDASNKVSEEDGSDVSATETATGETSFAEPINDQLYVLYEPSDGNYDMEIIFVHGFYTEGSSDPWRTTWTNKDGTCWPREFLGTRFPRIRILSVSYDACVITNSTQGRMRLSTVAESLLVNFFLSSSNVGQTNNCPVFFVGHGMGCFVIKNLIIKVSQRYRQFERERAKLLENVGGFVFYSPFNSGAETSLYENEPGKSNSLTDVIKVHNPDLSELNADFANLRSQMKEERKSRNLWKVLTICESHETESRTRSGLQRSETFVKEGTARQDCEVFMFGVGDHFNVCRHQSTKDVAYQCFESQLNSTLESIRNSLKEILPRESIRNPSEEILPPEIIRNPLEEILPRKRFSILFPYKLPFYSYEAFVEAAKTFVPQGFGVDGSEDEKRREIAALLAHFDHGTSGLTYKEYLPPAEAYCRPSNEFPCHPGKSYHGRGPLQLCMNYNYKLCGQGIGDDSLLSCPEKLSEDPVIAFKAALWFWCTPQCPKPSCHSVMTGMWTPTKKDIKDKRLPGFGLTINIINGYQPDKRVKKYIHFCKQLKVDPGKNIDCSGQKMYG